jgi:hypothetical protein
MPALLPSPRPAAGTSCPAAAEQLRLPPGPAAPAAAGATPPANDEDAAEMDAPLSVRGTRPPPLNAPPLATKAAASALLGLVLGRGLMCRDTQLTRVFSTQLPQLRRRLSPALPKLLLIAPGP